MSDSTWGLSGEAWTEADEIQFIRRLGHCSEQGAKVGRRELLLRYRSTMSKRSQWGKIRPGEVKKAITLALRA